MIPSKLYYRSTIWSNTSLRNLRKLQTGRNFAIRIFSGSRKQERITPVLYELNWLPFNYMLRFIDLITSFKYVNNLTLDYLSKDFKRHSVVDDFKTRKNNELCVSVFRTASGQRTFIDCIAYFQLVLLHILCIIGS